MTAVEKFEQTYGQSPEDVVFCPYRVCPIGAHSDHNLGKITGLALEKGIHVAFKPKQNGVIELSSLQFAKRAQWHVRNVPQAKQGDWADYLRGVTVELSARYPLFEGLCGVIDGDLPIGGLSSSASVCIAFLVALARINHIKLSDSEIIEISQAAENNYVGVSCGKLDQSCEVLSRAGHLLYLDCKDDNFELIPAPENMPAYDIVIFFSGLERSLSGTAFNMRVDEARSAAYAMMAYSGMPYGKFGEANLRYIPRPVYEDLKERLPENWRRRAEHWYTEFDRVERGAEAWRRGDLQAYGRLVFESGASSINNWETGCPELKRIYEIMTQTDGIYGGRFSGAGFKGCCMALVDPSYRESVVTSVRNRYLHSFPQHTDKYRSYVCKSSDGVKL